MVNSSPPQTYLAPVREQYERLPYPARDPADERMRLERTWLDDLPMINHYCFAGRQSFRGGFRVLVAGGGTGDATIFLAEQLRNTDAEIVHLDFSAASNAIARQRAEVRGLTNIRWVEQSLLALPELDVAPFDYINCVGVLHHLADPDAGLRALLSKRKSTGALGIMVYGRVGRTGIYQVQELLRLIGGGAGDMERQVSTAREVLASLPPTNWFKRGETLVQDHLDGADAGLYDLLLHSQDRAFSVAELYEWFTDGHGLHIELTDVYRGKSTYLPHMIVSPKTPEFLKHVEQRPDRDQHAIAELLRGDIITHSFYALAGDARPAPYGDPDAVPFMFHDPATGPELSELVRQHHGRPFVLAHRHSGIAVRVDPGRYALEILRHIDGKRSFAQIFAAARNEPGLRHTRPDDAALFRDFKPFFDMLRSIDVILLRHKSVEPV